MKKIKQWKKKNVTKSIAFISVISLVLQVSIIGLFNDSNSFTHKTYAETSDVPECANDIDIVLAMDRSGSMDEGGSLSKCEWSEMKEVSGSWISFLNIKYDITEQWCMDIRDEFDESSPYYSYKAPAYTPATNSRMVDAKTAANSFLGNLSTVKDQSSLVSFADYVSLDQELTNNHSATQSAVSNLMVSGATNIGDAIDLGITELGSERANPNAVKVMILLTDGKANKPDVSDPEDYAIQKAKDAAVLGYKIFTIGLGDNSEINETMLQQIADDTNANYYYAPTSIQLENIYEQISTRICQYGSISGCKYSDVDKNGDENDFSEEGTISNWEIILTDGINSPNTQLTDDNGCYIFSGLLSGTYSVSEGEKVGVNNFEQTHPLHDSYTDIILNNNDNLQNHDFGNYLPICDNGILDENYYSYNEQCDGILGTGEHQTCSDSCVLINLTYCGDGILQTPNDEGVGGLQNDGYEQCDDGNAIDGDGCSTSCQSEIISEPFCGDGNIDTEEACDDGNNNNGDGCSSECQIESTPPTCQEGETNTSYSGPEGTEGIGICQAGIQTCIEGTWGSFSGEVTPQGEICGNGIDEDCNGSDASCGGGGGTVITKPTIVITNEKVSYLGDGKAEVTWTTNIETTQQVVYGDDSIPTLGNIPTYGYDLVNDESIFMTKEHSVTISGLTDGIPYFFRPVADRTGSTGEKVGIEVFYEPGEVKGVEAPEPTPEQTCNYLLEYIKLGADNNPVEVRKLETFLNEFEGENLEVNGIYEQVDFDAVSRFQAKYFDLVLSPWSHNSSTGYVYITTKKRINEIYCQREFPLTLAQEDEVSFFSSRFLDSLLEPAQDQPQEESSQPEEDKENSNEQPQEESGEVAGAEDEVTLGDKEGEEDTEDEVMLGDKEDDETQEDVLLIGGDEEDDTAEDGSIVQSFKNFTSWTWILILIVIGAVAYFFLFTSKKKKQGDN